jgi:hypothetical protein
MKRETVLITIAAMLTFSLWAPLYAAAGRPEWEGLIGGPNGTKGPNHPDKLEKKTRRQKARQTS